MRIDIVKLLLLAINPIACQATFTKCKVFDKVYQFSDSELFGIDVNRICRYSPQQNVFMLEMTFKTNSKIDVFTKFHNQYRENVLECRKF